MFDVYYTDSTSGQVKRTPRNLLNESSNLQDKWIRLDNPDSSELEFVANRTGIQMEYLKAALDEEERSRIEKEDGNLLILVDVPITIEDPKKSYITYSTIPLGIIVNDNYFVTVCLQSTKVLDTFGQNTKQRIDFAMRSRATFQLLFQISTFYLSYLKLIDKASQRNQQELHQSLKNKELFELIDIQNSLVYFSTSIKSNDAVIDKLTGIRQSYIKKHEEDQDLIEDVAIENKQAMEMCTIYRDILKGTMDAYASIINNNLNNVMKILTSITLVLSVPTLIASLFGMNLDGIPGNTSYAGKFPWAFGVVVGISLLITAIIAIVLKKKKLM
ncbi:MAG: magnesium transporter CorA family protein [Clostridia bacterium]|nr:magnesium transporter CorA family protein [Clostridia bacterium]